MILVGVCFDFFANQILLDCLVFSDDWCKGCKVYLHFVLEINLVALFLILKKLFKGTRLIVNMQMPNYASVILLWADAKPC